jgi:hypothetical protein
MNEVIKTDFIEKLKPIVDGLWVMSETDAALEPFQWKKNTKVSPENILTKLHLPATTKITQGTIDDFFMSMSSPKEWHGDSEKLTVVRFQNLIADCKEMFETIQVFKVGEVKMDVFIVGVAKDGSVGGLKTLVVET